MSISKYKFGVTQGRLTKSTELQRFPQEAWQLEFVNASNLGISFIELLSEKSFNPSNPLWSTSGRSEIKNLCSNNKINAYSIVCDRSIEHSLIDDFNNNSCNHYINNLFLAASDLACSIVVLPLMEESYIDSDNMHKFSDTLNFLSNEAMKHNITICLETHLKSRDLLDLFELMNKDNIKAVFDTGNRCILDENIYSETLILNKYLKHVHIKDKDIDGNNVILGDGLANFKDFFLALNEINYSGPLVFETQRTSNPIRNHEISINLCNSFINNVK